MEKRQLGNTDLQIYPVAFGGNVFGWTIDEKKSFEILNGFTSAGFNFIDTADVYSRWVSGNSGGESEKIIGRWLQEKKNRQDIVLATKVGFEMGDGKKGLKKEYILKAVEDSLKRLKTDYIDLYQTHIDDESTPVQETLEAYAQLVKDGKVRWIGASNINPERLKESFETSIREGLPNYEALQLHYNLYTRQQYETDYETLALIHGTGVITYFSLERGFLTGKYRTKDDLGKSPRGAVMENYFNERGFKILDALDEIARQNNVAPATVSLSWLIQRPSVTAPIVSATSLEQLESIIKAPDLNLDADAIRFLNTASAW